MKIIAFILIAVALFLSLFNIRGVQLSNPELGLAVMLLLLSLFGDLKEFDFWGLKGQRREEKELKNLKDKPALKAKRRPKVAPLKLKEAQKEDIIQLLDDPIGNFLTLAYEIERLLRIAATALGGDELPNNMSPRKVMAILEERGLMTDDGYLQVDSIRWLRDRIIYGRADEMNSTTIEAGIEVAHNLYLELREWLAN